MLQWIPQLKYLQHVNPSFLKYGFSNPNEEGNTSPSPWSFSSEHNQLHLKTNKDAFFKKSGVILAIKHMTLVAYLIFFTLQRIYSTNIRKTSLKTRKCLNWWTSQKGKLFSLNTLRDKKQDREDIEKVLFLIQELKKLGLSEWEDPRKGLVVPSKGIEDAYAAGWWLLQINVFVK